ncbi:hypothetical protein DHD32_20675 [Arenibacter sp. TNZ]|jgi:RNA polymerase sigma-70 factor (ECF subfamily)|uniref:RNA polymerase sigma factor n=1 Tax=Arenibacter TaxID=178469 RepID=UPI000CD3C094|nr:MULTISPECIES: sigma factor [Arenibacter]MCM4173888.1 hypothetical protein [Arenibacter sp. TNZ]
MGKELENTFLEALEQNQQKLLRIYSVYAKDAEDTKDLFQEVLIHIWQSMPNFKSNSLLSTWIFRITLNVCLRLSKEILTLVYIIIKDKKNCTQLIIFI